MSNLQTIQNTRDAMWNMKVLVFWLFLPKWEATHNPVFLVVHDLKIYICLSLENVESTYLLYYKTVFFLSLFLVYAVYHCG